MYRRFSWYYVLRYNTKILCSTTMTNMYIYNKFRRHPKYRPTSGCALVVWTGWRFTYYWRFVRGIHLQVSPSSNKQPAVWSCDDSFVVWLNKPLHYNDVIMSAIASQITSLASVYSTVYSGADQRKHQSSASLAFVRKIHRWRVNSRTKSHNNGKIFPSDDVIMEKDTPLAGDLRYHDVHFMSVSWRVMCWAQRKSWLDYRMHCHVTSWTANGLLPLWDVNTHQESRQNLIMIIVILFRVFMLIESIVNSFVVLFNWCCCGSKQSLK